MSESGSVPESRSPRIESTTPTLTYQDLRQKITEVQRRHLSLQKDDLLKLTTEEELVGLLGERQTLIDHARQRGLLIDIDRYIHFVVEAHKTQKPISKEISDAIRTEFSKETEASIPQEFRGLREDYFYEQVKKRSVEELEWPPDPEEQVRVLSEKMSVLEVLRRPYRELQFNPDYIALASAIKRLRPETQAFFRSRQAIFDAWLLLPLAGGSVDVFSKVGESVGLMSNADTMLSRKEVARAFVELEKRSSKKEVVEKVENGKNIKELRKDNNPILADSLQLEVIRWEIALSIAKAAGEAGGDDQMAADKYIWAVRQAETIWRVWMRAALQDGPVFKPGAPDEIKSLRPTEIPQHWEELEKWVDWDNSFEGEGEFAIRRLLHSSLFLHKSKVGEARIRPYLYFGTQDFLSNFLDQRFLTNKDNFKDGVSFELVGNPGPNEDKVFIKTSREGRVEKIVVKRNGVVEIPEEADFDPSQIKWTAKGEDAYLGGFAYFNLAQGDEIRKALLSPDKLARDPSLKVLLDLYGSFDRFPTIQKDIEDKKNPEEERKKGKIYKEDVFMMLGTGLLQFQRHDLWKRFKQRNINLADVNFAVDGLRSKALITDEQVEEMKRKLMAIDGIEATKLIQLLVLTYYYTNPGGVLMAMLQEFLKQAMSLK